MEKLGKNGAKRVLTSVIAVLSSPSKAKFAKVLVPPWLVTSVPCVVDEAENPRDFSPQGHRLGETGSTPQESQGERL